MQTAEILALGLCDLGETLLNTRHECALYVAERFSRKNAGIIIRKKIKELLLNFLRPEDDYVQVPRLIQLFNTLC